MFELIKVLVDYLGKLLSPAELLKLKKEKDLRELGSRLFILYVRLNEIIVTGEKIIEDLEFFVSRRESELSMGERNEYTLDWGKKVMVSTLGRQQANIARFSLALQGVHFQMAIVDSDAYWKLEYLLHAKKTALAFLLDVLNDGKITLSGPTEQELKGHLEKLDIERVKSARWIAGLEFSRQVGKELVRDVVSVSGTWDNDVYSRIKTYLEKRKPRDQLKSLYAVATQLRKSLEKYLSVTDILLEVADEKFA